LNIEDEVQAYYRDALDEHHRYRSWEHCYSYFREKRPLGLGQDRDQAAIQLAFYLASWGMYRGSSFLLQYTYTVHRAAIDAIDAQCFTTLWNTDFGSKRVEKALVPTVCELIQELRRAYKPFALRIGSAQPTDTLITKIILGTFGCLPACDRYFLSGFKSEGFKYSSLNEEFVTAVFEYCQSNICDFQRQQKTLQKQSGVNYPLMKLVDMCFWQIGYQQTAGTLPEGRS